MHRKVVHFLRFNLTSEEIGVQLCFQHIAAPAIRHGLRDIPIAFAKRKLTIEKYYMARPIRANDCRTLEEALYLLNVCAIDRRKCLCHLS